MCIRDSPCALWYVAQAIAEQGADFVYTDEVTFEGDIDHLTAVSYTHLDVYKRQPLSKKLGEKAMEIRNELSKYFMVDYDDTGSIGKR